MELYTEEHGDGPPLLLLTGLGYAIWSWQRQLPDWSQRFRCIAVENRGTGRSPKPPGPYTIEELADDAAEALAGRRAHVAGFSMGGYIAQTLAVRHPELVDRLVLVCTATGGAGLTPTPPETVAAWEANSGRSPEEFARATMPLSFRPGWTDEHPEEFEALLADRLEYPTPPECWSAQYAACLDWTVRVTPVEQIEAPHARRARGRRPDPPVRERRRGGATDFRRTLRAVRGQRPSALPRVARALQPARRGVPLVISGAT